jgi:hypothetical protein
MQLHQLRPLTLQPTARASLSSNHVAHRSCQRCRPSTRPASIQITCAPFRAVPPPLSVVISELHPSQDCHDVLRGICLLQGRTNRMPPLSAVRLISVSTAIRRLSERGALMSMRQHQQRRPQTRGCLHTDHPTALRRSALRCVQSVLGPRELPFPQTGSIRGQRDAALQGLQQRCTGQMSRRLNRRAIGVVPFGYQLEVGQPERSKVEQKFATP